MINTTPLHMALRFRSERDDVAPGRAMADLRIRIAAETDAIEGRLPAARHMLVAEEVSRLMAIGIEDMPPAVDDIALLLDTVTFRLGETTRAAAWRSIGVNPNRGRDLLARSHSAFDWPLWFTLREAALTG